MREQSSWYCADWLKILFCIVQLLICIYFLPVPDNSTQFEAVPVVELDRWPSKEQLGLDESQYKALQTALTKEVAVIQGTPGTGKTYLGLKVSNILCCYIQNTLSLPLSLSPSPSPSSPSPSI